jgi:hypothetical protein
MEYGSDIDTHASASTSSNGAAPSGSAHAEAPAKRGGSGLRRTLLFVGIAAASAGIAFAIVRSTLARPPQDPTTERIQSLIDEANKLLKQLDEKKSG